MSGLLLVRLCSHRLRFVGGLTAVVFAAVLLAVPALATGMLGLNPSQGAAGDELLISGQGFEPSEQVKLRWDGGPFGRPVRSEANGEFTAARSIPIDALPGNHTVIAVGLRSGVTAEAFVEVIDPAVTTTTTSPATTTTTTSPATTTTTTSPATTTTNTPSADEKTTTSMNTATAVEGNTTVITDTTDNEGPLAVDQPPTASAEATPHSHVDIRGVTTNDISTGAGGEIAVDSSLGSALTNPVGLASAIGMPLLVAITVWWLYRKPNSDEQEPMR